MPTVALLESIYEAAFVPGRWPTALDALCSASGSASGSLLLWDGAAPPRWHATARSLEVLEGLASTATWGRPGGRARRLLEASIWDARFHCVEDLLSPRQQARDEVCRAYARAGLAWQVGTAVPLAARDLIILTFERALGDGRHAVAQLARLHALRPHLLRAGLIAHRLEMEHARGALDALAALGLPAALLDRNGCVRAVNASMRPGWIETRRGDQVVLGEATCDARLAAILHGQGGACSMALPQTSRAPARNVHVIPLTGATRDVFPGTFVLLLIAAPGTMPRRPDAVVLKALFNLSPAESRLAVALAEGMSLTGAAVRCNIRTSTARAYLEQIFHKTGCHRQAELVSLIAGFMHPPTGTTDSRPEG